MYAFVSDCVCVMQRESKDGLFFSMGSCWDSRGLLDWSFHNFGIPEYVEHAIGRYGNLTVTGAIHLQDPVYAINPWILQSVHLNPSKPAISKDGFSDRCALSKLQTFRKSAIETVWNWCPPGVIAS